MNIGVVIVTFNRLNKLKIALERFDKQVLPPKYILVVNNGSTDNTAEFLLHWKHEQSNFNRIVFDLNNNTGGSGGFAFGLREAIKLDAEWIWVSDDDAYPKEDALLEASNFLEMKNYSSISAICGSVISNDKIDLVHRKHLHRNGYKVEFTQAEISSYDRDFFEIDAFSYVGAVINKQVLVKVGVTIDNYFIWWDDTEHSLRIGECGKIFCVPRIIVYHDVDEQNKELSWKDYYGYRNQLDTYRKHFPIYVFMVSCAQMVLSAFKQLLIKRDYTLFQLKLCAAVDAIRKKSGLHKKYKPGWKP